MNKIKFIELFLDGGYWTDNKFFHPTFKKGWVTIKATNVSLLSAKSHFNKLGIWQSDFINGAKYFVK
jgi:hypothetical protein